ncbi:hypothetical protein Ciccas_008044, partial [Cichlidogyrus casuarinus]
MRIFVWLIAAFWLLQTECGPHEKRLRNKLFDSNVYDKRERPVKNHNEALEIKIKGYMVQVMSIDEKNQVIKAIVWIEFIWHDYNFNWSYWEYGNLTSIIDKPDNIWMPDIVLFSSADSKFDQMFKSMVVIQNDSQVQWMPPSFVRSSCQMHIRWFPFDDQVCEFKYSTWSHSKTKIKMELNSDEKTSVVNYIPSNEWALIVFNATIKTEKEYQYYIMTIRLQRRSLYYIFNSIVPCLILSLICLVQFGLPPDANEKITL